MAQEASLPASRVDIVRALREAAITALISFGMFLPLIGFNTVQNIHNELVLETRWPLLAALVGIITVGRFLHALLIAPRRARRAMRPRAGCLAAFWGILLGFPVLRLRGDYLAIVTLAFGEIIRLVLINWVPVTNGYAGISSIPRPTFFGIPFNASDEGFAARLGLEFSPIYRTIFLYYVILALALVTAAITF